jgi:ribosomal protein L37E
MTEHFTLASGPMSNARLELTYAEDGMLEHDCPRCGRRARQRFYGPCAACYDELATTMSAEPTNKQPERAAFEPKMNVTPNFVATKD